MQNNLDQFTERARHVLDMAQEEAVRLQHSYIGSEHLLLGFMREEGGLSRRVLRDVGLDQRRVEELVERMTRAGQRAASTRLELSPGMKKVVELAVDEARRMGHPSIASEHLFLGLVQLREGVAIDVLKRLNVSPEEVRQYTYKIMLESGMLDSSLKEAFLRPPKRIQSVANYNWFTVLEMAYTQARNQQHKHVGPEHLLLALLQSERDPTWYILDQSGVMFVLVKPLVAQLPSEKIDIANPEPSPELIRVLGCAVSEVFRVGSPYLRTDHLLLGLIASGDNAAIGLLKQLNVDPAAIEKAVREAPLHFGNR